MIATRGGKLGRGTGFGVAEDGDPAYTITAAHPHAVCAGFGYKVSSGAGSIGYRDEQAPTLLAGRCDASVLIHGGWQPETVGALCAPTHPSAAAPAAVNGLHSAPASPSAGKVIATEEPRSAAVAIDRATTPKFSEELCHTLRRGGAGGCNDAVAVISQYGEVAGTLTARYDSSPCPDRGQNIVGNGSVVRRLTPRECERLQGMPDDWTRIPYRGKSAEDCPDGPRYKAIGNSMAVPVMRWIGERIAMVDKLEGRLDGTENRRRGR